LAKFHRNILSQSKIVAKILGGGYFFDSHCTAQPRMCRISTCLNLGFEILKVLALTKITTDVRFRTPALTPETYFLKMCVSQRL